ncbi:MAG: hypothetical protein ACFNKF_04185 [Treponema lecithinolyticum]|uniref:hypothetical protein n=1 Tax=Treponema lecithinolyticum TaxID=53418 RepID=UPI003620EC28
MKKIIIGLLCIFLGMHIFAENVYLEIELALHKGTEKMYVDEDSEKLSFSKPSYVKKIKGLEKLKSLKTIVFINTAFITDFNFLKDAASLENLIIYGIKISNPDFIKTLHKLKNVILDSCSLYDLSFDLSENPDLEYIDVSYNYLKSLPVISNNRKLKYINVSYNEIKKTEMRDMGVLIFAAGNDINEKNIITDDAKKYLPNDIVSLYANY